MKKGAVLAGVTGLAAAVLAYVLVMWGLLLLLFFLYGEIPWLPGFNILSLETLLPLAIGSLLPVFGAQLLLNRRLALPWISVRLVTPFIGFPLFVVTVIGFFPVLLQNLFILFPIVIFVLLQSGIVLLSICFTALRRCMVRRIRRAGAGENSRGQVSVTDPRLRSIRLPPGTKLVSERSDSSAAHTRKRDWKSSVCAALLVAVIVGGMCAMLIWFPSAQIAMMFWPAVTMADIKAQPGDWSGRRAGPDIPRMTGLGQLEDGTFEHLDWLTVETDNLIPLSYYKLKDSADSRVSGSNGYAQSRSNIPMPGYTRFAGINAMYYGQYCVVELEDGSYIGAFVDSSYTTVLGKVQLPVGRVVLTNSVEAAFLTEAAETYPMPTDCLLMMHSDKFYKQLKLPDHGIRMVAILSVPVVPFVVRLSVLLIAKKRRS